MTLKALVFDMDGTLLNTLEDLADSTNAALCKHGFPTKEIDKYRFFVGSGARELIRRALPTSQQTDDTIDQVLADYKQHYDGNWANKTHLYAGIADALSFAQAHDLQLAILTNKPQAFANLCVQHFLPDWSFTVVQGQVDGVAHKPSAEVSARVTEALQVKPEQVLYFGDSDIDMQTAQNAGYQAIGVTWGFRDAEELLQAGASQLIHDPIEIIDLVKTSLNSEILP
ncbi:MAG: HAD family hydrolase [Reinekea sp.]|nr:HAD family hydrolase [Reinekea sp.]